MWLELRGGQVPRGRKQELPVLLSPGFRSSRTSSLWSSHCLKCKADPVTHVYKSLQSVTNDKLKSLWLNPKPFAVWSLPISSDSPLHASQHALEPQGTWDSFSKLLSLEPSYRHPWVHTGGTGTVERVNDSHDLLMQDFQWFGRNPIC